ncbi:MAG: hypothetical protein WBM09_11615 [Gallionella sp.]
MKNFRFWSVIVLAVSLTACTQKAQEAPPEESLTQTAPAPVVAEPAPAPVTTAAPAPEQKSVAAPKPAPEAAKHFKSKAKPMSPQEVPAPAEANKTTDFTKIKAELAADPLITTPGNPGDLRVWIGDPDLQANSPAGMTVASAVIVTPLKPSTVRVTPNAPAFDVTPESTCSKFDPTGTTVHFELRPKLEQAGKYRVGAGVWLYDSIDCTGTPNPKDAPNLQVEVVVKVIPYDMWKTVREGISKFWVGLVALVVGLLLFFARNFLKKMFGFEEK